jgi:hypothetical protein
MNSTELERRPELDLASDLENNMVSVVIIQLTGRYSCQFFWQEFYLLNRAAQQGLCWDGPWKRSRTRHVVNLQKPACSRRSPVYITSLRYVLP